MENLANKFHMDAIRAELAGDVERAKELSWMAVMMAGINLALGTKPNS